MPHRLQLRIVLLAIIALVCSGLAACDALTRVEGTVVDNAGNPLPGVAVRLTRVSTGRTSQMSTGEDGKFSVEQIHGPFAGRFDLVVSKPGYEDFHRVVQTKTRPSLRIVMTKTPIPSG